jgi:ABC-type branched-subunit amino acid transport system ATPase component
VARLTLKNLSKNFGEVAALRNVSLDIHDKEFFVLLGPTGAGPDVMSIDAKLGWLYVAAESGEARLSARMRLGQASATR